MQRPAVRPGGMRRARRLRLALQVRAAAAPRCSKQAGSRRLRVAARGQISASMRWSISTATEHGSILFLHSTAMRGVKMSICTRTDSDMCSAPALHEAGTQESCLSSGTPKAPRVLSISTDLPLTLQDLPSREQQVGTLSPSCQSFTAQLGHAHNHSSALLSSTHATLISCVRCVM